MVAIVLAAGASVRMGRPKLLLSVGGRSLLDRTLDAVGRSRVRRTVVVLGAHADALRAAVALKGATVVVNPEYAEGMSTSIRAGLRTAGPNADAYLIVLGDEPFVAPETMDHIIAAWGPGGPLALIPTFRGRRGHPILVDRRLAPRIEEVSGDTGYRTFFREDEVREVPVDDPGILFDVDSPGDLEDLEQGLRSGRPLAQTLEDLVQRRKDRLG